VRRLWPFRFEHEMAAPARNWLKQQGLLVKAEFSTPWGICDFVGASFARDRVLKRLSLGQRDPIGPPSRIALLDRIPDVQTGEIVSYEELEGEFEDWLSPDGVFRSLQALIDSRFVFSPAPYHFQKLNGWVPLHWRIVAMELKLSRVEEALSQARSHLRFATHSYVGLPDALANRVAKSKRRWSFLNAGVGIVAVRKAGCEVLLPSRGQAKEKDRILEMHCVERFWRTWITGSGA